MSFDGNNFDSSSPMVNMIWNILLWSILPPLATSIILHQYYALRYSQISRPKKGTPLYTRHYDRLYALVVLLYFIGCMVYYVKSDMEPNFYRELGLYRTAASDEELRQTFRNAVRRLHPDKNPGIDPKQFIRVKNLYYVLEDSDTRARYDVYGPSIMNAVASSSAALSSNDKNVNTTITAKDYFYEYFSQWVGFYGGTFLVMVLIGMLRGGKYIYWRFVAILSAALAELYIAINPKWFGGGALKGGFPTVHPFSFVYKPVFDFMWYNLTVYERLCIMRQFIVYGCMALPQLISLASSFTSSPNESASNSPATNLASETNASLVTKIYDLINGKFSREIGLHFSNAFEPVKDEPELCDHLKRKMGQLTVELSALEAMDPAERRRLVATASNSGQPAGKKA